MVTTSPSNHYPTLNFVRMFMALNALHSQICIGLIEYCNEESLTNFENECILHDRFSILFHAVLLTAACLTILMIFPFLCRRHRIIIMYIIYYHCIYVPHHLFAAYSGTILSPN